MLSLTSDRPTNTQLTMLHKVPVASFLKSGVAAQFHYRLCLAFPGETMSDTLANLGAALKDSKPTDIEAIRVAGDRTTELHEYHTKRREILMKTIFEKIDENKDGT